MGLQTTTISDFRKGIKSYVDEVIDEHETIIIARKNKGVVVMSLDEYNSILETAHLLSSSKNADRLRESIAQAKSGKLLKKKLME
jgi:antitoxin YefM